MKAAISLPTIVLITILIGVIVVVVVLGMIQFVNPITNTQVLEGYMINCCNSYIQANKCSEPDPGFNCTVGATGEKMAIGELADKLGVDVDRKCCG